MEGDNYWFGANIPQEKTQLLQGLKFMACSSNIETILKLDPKYCNKCTKYRSSLVTYTQFTYVQYRPILVIG